MKIAFIVSEFPTLSETFILNQITGFLDMGHDVKIFAEYNSKEKKIHQDVEKYQLAKKVYYFNMPRNKIKRVLRAIYLIITNFHKNPIKILKSLNVFKYSKESLSLKLLYLSVLFLSKTNKKFDIIHCHFGSNGILGTYLKEIGIGNKVVTVFHGYDMSAYVPDSHSNIYKNLFVNGDLFLPVSEFWKEKLIKMGCDKNKIVVHRMGVDLEKFKFLKKGKRTDDSVKILTIARLMEKKGHKYVIQAIAKLVQKYKNIEYIIAGDGHLRNELECLVSELRIEKYVRFLGVVKQNEILELYQRAHIFVLPSITAYNNDQEGIPVVLMEAQAVGLPVVSTFHSGISEVVANNKSGFLVPEGDINALAERLEYLIRHQEKWFEMGRNGREIIEKKYNIKKLNQQLVEIFKSLLTNVN